MFFGKIAFKNFFQVNCFGNYVHAARNVLEHSNGCCGSLLHDLQVDNVLGQLEPGMDFSCGLFMHGATTFQL